jgi:hypothetical protein
MPAPSDQLAPGQSITVNVTFHPTEVGTFNDQIGLQTTGGNESVGLSGSATPPGHLEISPAGLDFGRVAPGQSKDSSFTITNSGGTPVTIMKSKPPESIPFTALTSLDEGSTVAAHTSITEKVRFTPASEGSFAATWPITGNDDTGPHSVQFSGTGAYPVVTTGSTPTILPPGIGELPPRVVVRVKRTYDLLRALRHGLVVRVRSNRAGRVVGAALLGLASAKRLGIARAWWTVVARGRRSISTPYTTIKLRLRFKRKLRHKLRRAHAVRLRLRLRVTDGAGRSTTRYRRIRLRRHQR